MTRLLRRLVHVLRHPVVTLRHLQQRRAGFVTDPHGFRRRAYRSYQHYLTEQGEKIDQKGDRWLDAPSAAYETALLMRLTDSGLVTPGLSVLCLGARLGGEVRAFRALGAFAIGIDVNAGKANPFVCYGDFHHLEYASGSIGLVFTNALDHVFDLDRVLSEVHRVLRPDGVFVTELVKGNATGTPYGFYDAIGWTDVEQVVRAIEAQGFTRQIVEPVDERGRQWAVFQRR